MEHQKILNFWNEASDSKYVTKNGTLLQVLKSNLCNYNDAYILVKDDITIVGDNGTQVAFENCEPFNKFITKIDRTTIDVDEELDLVMLMYKLLEYTLNWSMKKGSIWFYSKEEATDFMNDIGNTNYFKFCKHKAKLIGNTKMDEADGTLRNAAIAVPFKYPGNYWRLLSLEMPLINCKVKLKFVWTKHCVLSLLVVANAHNDVANSYNNFTIKDPKVYVPVVILSAKDNQKLSKHCSKGFERSVYWDEYKAKG